MENSKFQFVRINEERVVVRFYNEENDRFEKVCACGRYFLHEDMLLRADSDYYFAYDGKLYFLGKGKVVVSSRFASGILRMFDTSQLKLPFKAVFLLLSYERHFVCAQDYELAEDSARIKMLSGKTKVYEYSYDEPDLDGHQDCFLTSWDE